MTNYNKKFKKYNESVLPIFSYENDEMKYIMFNEYKTNKGKIKKDAIIYSTLTDSLSEVIKDNFYHAFNTLIEEQQEDGTVIQKITHSHAHDFDSVVHQVYYNPKEFSIDEEDRELYSKQEYDFLMRLRSYLMVIERRNITFNDELDDINELGLDSKAIEYSNYAIKTFDNDSTAKNIIEKKRNYLITPKYSDSSSLVNKRYLIMDNDSNILGLIEIVKSKSKLIDDLTEEDVDYRLDGFRSLSVYKKTLKEDLNTHSCCDHEEVKEVFVNRVKVIKKFK